jgi:glutamyl-tRNA reductase
MLDNLVLYNFPSGYSPEIPSGSGLFVMATCQRTLILGYGREAQTIIQNSSKINANVISTVISTNVNVESKTGKLAYSYLLEIICGLKSKLVGENEIVGQFKSAYQLYNASSERNSKLLAIIEKLFKDAKEIRTNYLLGLSQKTYSSIARKHIVSRHKAKSVLILGSGQLAEDLINQFKKKVDVFISARNEKKVQQLADEHSLSIIPWGNADYLHRFAYIANSIGYNGTLLGHDFFETWSQKHERKLFVDLGSPSAIQTHFNYAQGVMKLDDVFQEGAVHETHKKQQIEKAKQAMDGIVKKRHQIFINKKLNHPNNKADHQYV